MQHTITSARVAVIYKNIIIYKQINMKREDLKKQLENGREYYGYSQTVKFVDGNGNKLSSVGVNFVDERNTKKSSALVSSEEKDFKNSSEYTKGDILDFIARGCMELLSIICVDKNGKETKYNKATVLGNTNDGTGGPDKILIELSN